MKDDPDCDNTSELYNPITLLKTIEKIIMAQTEDQYCYASVYNQECELYSFQQHSLTTEQYCERFNKNIGVWVAIGITIQHHVLIKDTT